MFRETKDESDSADRRIVAQLREGSLHLSVCSSTPCLDAEILLAHVLSLSRTKLILNYNQEVGQTQISEFRKLLKLREVYSVAAITGEKEFWKHSFIVDKNVLIPRPDTETMLTALLSRRKNPLQALKIVELGTGSGCLIISILKEFRNALGFGFEKSRAAFRISMANAIKHDLYSRLRLYRLDFINANTVLPCKVDVIISNPPYIRRSEIPHLAVEVQHEPQIALDGGFNGILPYFSILKLSKQILRPGGEIFLEIGESWRDSIATLNSPFRIVKKYRDLSGAERVLLLK